MSKPYEYNQKSIKVEGNFSADENWKFWFHDNHPTCYNRESKFFIKYSTWAFNHENIFQITQAYAQSTLKTNLSVHIIL